MSKHLLFILILAVCTNVFAQQTKSISGVVYDSNTGEALIGVSVLEVGTTNGTITDFDGKYTLKVSSNKVSFSYVGFKTEIVNVTNSGTYNVNLVSDNKLDEVVVIGYGTQRKSDLTGALASISSKDIKNYAVSNASELLTGKAAGVFVAASSGQPGSDAVIRVRGLGTVNDNNPLYVVDGQFMDNISSLNPSDIESINFLKDASAAIYGSKAAGGVILVQTKKAKAGKTKIEYNGSVTAKLVGLQPTLMTLDEWGDAVIQARTNDGYKSDDTWLRYVALAKANRGHYIDLNHSQNPYANAFTDVKDFVFFDTDWQDILWGTTASTSHELSVAGGTDRNTYRLSARYMYDGSNLKWGNNNNQRYNLRLSNTFHVTDAFEIESVIAYSRQDQVAPTQIGAALTSSVQQPGFPSSTIDGKPCELGGDNKLKVSGVNISETFKYKFNKHFDAVATLGYNTSTSTRDIQGKSIDWYNYAGTEVTMTNPTADKNYYYKTFSRTDMYTLNAYLNWHQTFAEKHNLMPV